MTMGELTREKVIEIIDFVKEKQEGLSIDSFGEMSFGNRNSEEIILIDFSGEDLSGLDLSGLDFKCVNFEGANLSGANLQGANVWGASFKDANIEGANFKDVELLDVDWRGVKGVHLT